MRFWQKLCLNRNIPRILIRTLHRALIIKCHPAGVEFRSYSEFAHIAIVYGGDEKMFSLFSFTTRITPSIYQAILSPQQVTHCRATMGTLSQPRTKTTILIHPIALYHTKEVGGIPRVIALI